MQSRWFNRLSVHDVLAFRAKADEVAGIGNTDNLATAIRQHLEKRHRSGLDSVYMGRRITVYENKFLGFHALE